MASLIAAHIVFPLVWLIGFAFAVFTGLLRWATPMRYAIVAGMILVAAPPYIFFSNNALLAGIFVLETNARIVVFAAMSMLTAVVVVGTFQAARVSRPIDPDENTTVHETKSIRVTIRGRPVRVNRAPLVFFLALGSAPVVFAGLMTSREYDVPLPEQPTEWDPTPPHILVSSILGVGIGLLLAALVGAYQTMAANRRHTMPGILPFEFDRVGDRTRENRITTFLSGFRFLIRKLPDGSSELAPGVTTLASLFFVLVVFYGLVFLFPRLTDFPDFSSAREVPGAGTTLSAGFFLLLLLAIGTLFLGGLAFVGDHFRVPTLLIVGLLIVPAFAADSYFALVPDEPNPHASAKAVLPEWKSVFQTRFENTVWQFPPRSGASGEPTTMVVVVAPGGGIQATAWTAKALTGLDELLVGFGESIGLLSGVSGGSVGIMYYVVGRGDRTNSPEKPMNITPETAFNINWQARKSSLDAVAWALTYPKAVQPLSLLRPSDTDHGWALKMSWHLRLRQMVYNDASKDKNMYDDRLYLRGWCDKIRRAQAPPFVFNATVIESGKRLTITPVVPERKKNDEDFLALFPESAPHLATAARLSAAFPYVSPSSRALPYGKQDLDGCHIVDGGYSDNEGIVTAVEWIEAMLEHRIVSGEPLPFDRILIVRLQPFHTDDKKHDPLAPQASTILGPLFAVNNARGASQSERGKLEAKLLIAAAEVKQNERRAYESNKTANEIKKETDATGPNVLAALAKRKPNAPSQATIVDHEARQYNLAVQMAVSNSPGWDKDESIRDRLKKSLADRIDPEDIKKLEPKEVSQAIRVDALETNLARLDPRITRPIPIFALTIPFTAPKPCDDESGKEAYREPLSWKLTPRQERAIDDAWKLVETAIKNSSASAPDAGKMDNQELSGPEALLRFFKLKKQ